MTDISRPSGPIVIDGELNIYTASEWRDRLSSETAGRPEIALDLSAVEEIDAAGLQLLIATRRQAANDGCDFRIAAVSPAVRLVLEFSRLPGLMPAAATLLPLPQAA